MNVQLDIYLKGSKEATFEVWNPTVPRIGEYLALPTDEGRRLFLVEFVRHALRPDLGANDERPVAVDLIVTEIRNGVRAPLRTRKPTAGEGWMR